MPLIAKTKDPSVSIRFPKQVLVAVKRSARKNGRSQNSEVVYRVSEGLGLIDKASTPPADVAPAPDPAPASDLTLDPAPDRTLATTP